MGKYQEVLLSFKINLQVVYVSELKIISLQSTLNCFELGLCGLNSLRLGSLID